MKQIISYSLLAALTVMVGCKPNLKPMEISKGTADFTTYVAMGNSLCAGYSDGGLSKSGQENSFPRMLAQQFALAGGGEFKTPFMAAAGNGSDVSGNPIYSLVINPATGSPVPIRTGVATTIADNVSAGGLYNHIGIPGARALDALLPASLYTNPFLTRMVGTNLSKSMLGLALEKKPTFFTYWLGSNDVLLWAIEGGSGPVQTDPSMPGFPGTLSEKYSLSSFIKTAIDSLTKNGAKGAIANIPDVASTPFFTTIPYNCIPVTRQSLLDSLTISYKSYDSLAALSGKPLITWKIGANAPVIEDATAFLGRRQATAEDLICLTASDVLPTGAGTATPLANKYVLDAKEILLAKDVTDFVNIKIKEIAEAKGLALVDANTYLKTIKSGIIYNNVAVNAKFVEGGGFSLDGVHPTPRGYAILANQFILAINAKYGSSIPNVDINKYRGVLLP